MQRTIRRTEPLIVSWEQLPLLFEVLRAITAPGIRWQMHTGTFVAPRHIILRTLKRFGWTSELVGVVALSRYTNGARFNQFIEIVLVYSQRLIYDNARREQPRRVDVTAIWRLFQREFNWFYSDVRDANTRITRAFRRTLFAIASGELTEEDFRA